MLGLFSLSYCRFFSSFSQAVCWLPDVGRSLQLPAPASLLPHLLPVSSQWRHEDGHQPPGEQCNVGHGLRCSVNERWHCWFVIRVIRLPVWHQPYRCVYLWVLMRLCVCPTCHEFTGQHVGADRITYIPGDSLKSQWLILEIDISYHDIFVISLLLTIRDYMDQNSPVVCLCTGNC